MLDIKFIRANPDKVKASQKNRNKDPEIVDKLLKADEQRRQLQSQLDELKAQKNQASKQIGSGGDKDEIISQMKKVDQQAEQLSLQLKDVNQVYEQLLASLPNVPGEQVPIGRDESENKVLRTWGEKPKFDFQPLAHEEIGKNLDLIDTEISAQASGARFSYLKNELVLLQWGMMWLGWQVLTNADKLKEVAKLAGDDFNTKPFVPILPPDILRGDVYRQIGRLSHIEDDVYKIDGQDLYLTGSAEHSLLPLHLNQTIDAKRLPLRYVGFSTAFRQEAGTYGKDTKGILRQHQFDKLEMLSFCLPEDAEREHKFFVAIQEYLMQQLAIPYQVIAICTGDIGPTNVAQIDIEAWFPSQGKYRETHTADYNGDYQARGMNTKYKDQDGSKGYVHTNDATVFSRRPLIAILENNQQADGSLKVPQVLVPYVGFDTIKAKK